MKTIREISQIRSPLYRDIVRFLRAQKSKLNDLHWKVGSKCLLVEDVYVEPDVITERPKQELYSGEGDREQARRDHKSLSEVTGLTRLYEMSSDHARRERSTWTQAIEGSEGKVLIYGAPGSGKTFVTKFTIIERIENLLLSIEQMTCQQEDIQLPIWVTAQYDGESN